MLDPQLSVRETLLREWPAVRAALLDVAAAVDRLERAGASDSDEWRMIHAILGELERGGDDRAERVLSLLSRGYDPEWRERFAAGERSADLPESLTADKES